LEVVGMNGTRIAAALSYVTVLDRATVALENQLIPAYYLLLHL
jgi:hypothetical protein